MTIHNAFLADAGAMYVLRTSTDAHAFGPGMLLVKGVRTDVEYLSAANSITVTGGYRNHAKNGWGARAVLTLDTGEGIVTMRGIVR